MPRIARFTRDSKSTVYHVISRTALPGLPIRDVDKDYLLGLMGTHGDRILALDIYSSSAYSLFTPPAKLF